MSQLICGTLEIKKKAVNAANACFALVDTRGMIPCGGICKLFEEACPLEPPPLPDPLP